LKRCLIVSRFLQAICRIEKNIFSVLAMPFGQRSLPLIDGLTCALHSQALHYLSEVARSGMIGRLDIHPSVEKLTTRMDPSPENAYRANE
jgi:hypothetical protein